MQYIKNPFVYPKLLWAMIKFVRDPRQLDNVISISADLHSKVEMDRIIEHFSAFPDTKKRMEDQPRIGLLNVDELMKLPSETLGRQYAEFMKERGLAPEDLYFGRHNDLPDWILHHFYESHDLWHVMTGFDTDVAGEFGLQAYYAAKGPSPFPLMILALGFLNTVFFAREEKDRRFNEIVRGWNLGKKTKHLFGVDWKSHFVQPIEEVRQEFRFPMGAT